MGREMIRKTRVICKAGYRVCMSEWVDPKKLAGWIREKGGGNLCMEKGFKKSKLCPVSFSFIPSLCRRRRVQGRLILEFNEVAWKESLQHLA